MTAVPTDTHPGHRPLRDLTPEECWVLATTRPVGRLAWNSVDGPRVVPVNFVIEDDRVEVRTAAYSELARECDDSPVAFEVDEIDEAAHGGWSVLIRGRAHVDYHAGLSQGPTAWPEGSRALLLSVSVHEITGRRVG